MTEVRLPAVAGLFYPADPAACAAAVDRCFREAGAAPAEPAVAAVAPHAGWTFSGTALAAAILALEASRPETVILFGAAHYPENASAPSVHPGPAWATPLGEVAVDGELAEALAAAGPGAVPAAASPHAREHSLEVIVPFLRRRLPGVRMVPVLTPPAPAPPPSAGGR